MPPFISRKRSRSVSPAPTPPSKRSKPISSSSSKNKQTLFDAADASTRKHRSAAETHKLLSSLGNDDDDRDSSSLSDVDSDEFEDVKPAHPPRRQHKKAPSDDDGDDDDEDEDDGMDWEDAIPASASASASVSTHGPRRPAAEEIADISVSVHDDGSYVQPIIAMTSNNAGKKGPSKRERQIRVQTHCLHVLTLLWHNAVRNSWLNDAQVQTTLRGALPEGVRREVTRWREAMGMLSKEELAAKKRQAAAKAKRSGRRTAKGKEGRNSARDWSYAAEHLEQGVPDLSRGDPLLRLLKVLAAYWRKRFVVVAPALRKQGYMTLMRLRDEVKDWNKNRNDAETHGERIENLEAFRKSAVKCEGSRDVGAQLFVALLRAVGLETRMVANLQPAGFGWSKAEEAGEKRSKKGSEKDPAVVDDTSDNSDIDQSPAKPPPTSAKKPPKKQARKQPSRQSTRGKQTDPINLDDSDSPLSSVASEPENSTIRPGDDGDDDNEDDEDDDISVVDVTPITPRRPTKKFDRDLAFPTYWTEVRSPVSNKYIPVDPIVLSTIASNEDLLQTFEPRGKKADKTKQVICYTIAFSADGSAKDVTVRYLKKHQLPGKTKGVRMPIEKVPVYNRSGKVKKYEDYDWFRTVISMYDRAESKRTAADDLEDQTDLKPYKPAKEDKELEKESLQWYKQSAEYVLEQHLRREEAIVPGAEPVKTFVAGKGDKAKEHPVYRREDVVPCKTVESWHKEGREIKMGEQPFKYVPMRAVTLIRKREIEDAQRETGEKLKQGLYSREQTDWIIPPPIKNGVIPKNAFGNMDVYVPTMVPKGAVHLRLKGSAKICRKLDVDYAEACTGFEFGKQRAVPILTGVVVAKENAQMVKDAWQTAQEEIQRKEDTKRTGLSLHWWRKMLMGLRIVERMREEYHQNGGTEEESNPFVNKAKREGRNVPLEFSTHEESGGGFLLPGHEDEGSQSGMHAATREVGYDHQDSGGFLVEDDLEHASGGGFLVEEDDGKPDQLSPSEKGPSTVTPVSLQSIHNTDEDVLRDVNGGNDSDVSLQPDSYTNGNGEVSDIDTSVPRKKASTKLATTYQQSRTATNHTRRRGRSSTKNTPVKSQYFADGVEEDEDDESAVEVVQPRRTTARTKKKT